MGRVVSQDRGAGDELLIDRNIRAVLMAIGWRVFRSINRGIERSPDVYPGHIVKGETGLPAPSRAEVGLQVSKARGSSLRVKCQLGGRGNRASLHVVLEGLLVSEV